LASPADAKWRLHHCIDYNILALLPHSSIDESTIAIDEALPAMDSPTGISMDERRRAMSVFATAGAAEAGPAALEMIHRMTLAQEGETVVARLVLKGTVCFA
jgi:mannitol/fructose-specific phosphotransferase system IIA component